MSEDTVNFLDEPADVLRCYQKLMGYGEQKIYPANTIIASSGDECAHCFILADGQVIAFDYTETGAEHNYILHDSPNMLMETQLLMNKTIPVYFRTTKRSKLFAISRETLLRAMAADFEIAALVVRTLADKFDYAMQQSRKKDMHGAMWNLCELLIDFAARYGTPYDGKIMISDKISQQMMSNLLRINRITVVRNINELKSLGLIEQVNGYYCIRKMDELRRFQNDVG